MLLSELVKFSCRVLPLLMGVGMFGFQLTMSLFIFGGETPASCQALIYLGELGYLALEAFEDPP